MPASQLIEVYERIRRASSGLNPERENPTSARPATRSVVGESGVGAELAIELL